MGLAVLFVVLCVSVPSYGHFLIYNLSGSVKGVNGTAQASIPWKGYLLMNISDSTSKLVDANLIMYGKDSSKKPVYVEHDYNATDVYQLDMNSWVQGSFWAFNLRCNTTAFDFDGLIIGKAALTDIGLGAPNKKWVTSSATGTMMVWKDMLLDPVDDIAGGGTISASLYTVATKYANSTNGTTQDQLIASGIQQLKNKGFNPATLPE